MKRGYPQKREKAFRLRLERKTIAEISREVGVSDRTVSRWENGWVDAKGRKTAGWKPELEKAWRKLADAELQYGLMLKEERLKTYEELARLAVAKIKEMFPSIRAKTAADAKALMSEVRELMRLIAEEKGDYKPRPHTLVAVKTDITLNEISERYRNAHADREEGKPDAGGTEPVAGDE
ncbi:MAG: helix-turn-helix domain-containing protein [Deltaproteobacteria bacterium]|nr:MAG: helix-turn-helix domain-containing protein [Deltaproteobacteria bacterium]